MTEFIPINVPSPVPKTFSTTLIGIEAFPVEIEAQARGGKNDIIRIVGLPDGVLRESRERVRCAVTNSGFSPPPGELVVSLAPADLPKTGSGFELAIALAIIAAGGQIDSSRFSEFVFVGELALDGRLKPVPGILSTALLCRRLGKVLIAPKGSHLGVISDVEIYVADSLNEVIGFLMGQTGLGKAQRRVALRRRRVGFGDVRGQHLAKRALEISAAGGHNLLMVGPPGSGKSMLAERLPSILPALSEDEHLEVVQIVECSEGKGARIDDLNRPFRAPHYTTSLAGLIGGGLGPRPGEISLAHRGVLFLDELPEFRRDALESLRQPLESRKVTVSRANQRITFPADFTLIAAMNACPCGRRGGRGELCRCLPPQIKKYLARISGPIVDRIDLQLWVNPVESDKLFGAKEPDETEAIRKRVEAAHELQLERNKGRLNSRTGELEGYLEDGARALLRTAVEKLALSARGYTRTLRVARTIADLAGSDAIRSEHTAEALSYRISLTGS
jgi:magnesium chelatase family protein